MRDYDSQNGCTLPSEFRIVVSPQREERDGRDEGEKRRKPERREATERVLLDFLYFGR